MALIASNSAAPGRLPPPPAPGCERPPRSWVRFTALGLVVLAGVAVAIAAGLLAFGATFELWGDKPSEREEALARQAGMVAVWAAASIVGAALALVGRGVLALSAGAWIAALLATTPWRWPSPPSTLDGDHIHVPIWHHASTRPLLLALAAVCLAYGAILAWRHGNAARIISVVTAGSVMVLLGVSSLRLHEARQAEEPFPTARGEATLRAAEAEPIWASLPPTAGSTMESHVGTAATWREEWPSSVRWFGPSNDTTELFAEALAAAEHTGWSLIAAECGDQPRAHLTKEVGSEPATVTALVARGKGSVSMTLRVEPAEEWMSGDTIERC